MTSEADSEGDKDSAAKLIDPTKSTTPVERASESIMATTDYNAIRQAKPPAIPAPAVSAQIELGQDFYPETPTEGVSLVPPPPSFMTNPFHRPHQGMPLSGLVGISAGVIVVLVALSLLLFR
jgi:hypothetical protein